MPRVRGTDKNTAAEMEAEVTDALEAENLDHLVRIAVDTDLPTTVHDNSVLGFILAIANVANYDRTTDSKEALGAAMATIIAAIAAQDALVITERITKTLTFDGGTPDAVGDFDGTGNPATIFTVTGLVDVSLEAVCTTNLVGATATIKLGLTGSEDKYIAATLATDLTAKELWFNDAPAKSGTTDDAQLTSDASLDFTIYDGDVVLTVEVANITAGVIEFSVIYTKRTSGALVEVA